ncbi:MAG TPA: DMT family transporter, partial [Bacillota bacterium]|nr:DMT family transporter [Bacillota bacterium]
TGAQAGELSTLQNLLGAILLWVIAASVEGLIVVRSATIRQLTKLMLVGCLLGLTGAFYYVALTEMTAGMGIILLFQFVWLGMLLEYALDRRRPGKHSIMALLLIIPGTLLAVGGQFQSAAASWWGIVLGLLSALTYAAFIYASGRIATEVPAWTRSAVVVTGATLINLVCFPPFYLLEAGLAQAWPITLLWGSLMGIFGPVIPTVCLAFGVPVIGAGLASVLCAVELPTVIATAWLFLGEQVKLPQWLGALAIVGGIVVSERKKES